MSARFAIMGGTSKEVLGVIGLVGGLLLFVSGYVAGAQSQASVGGCANPLPMESSAAAPTPVPAPADGSAAAPTALPPVEAQERNELGDVPTRKVKPTIIRKASPQ
jgi:hypothetical protein